MGNKILWSAGLEWSEWVGDKRVDVHIATIDADFGRGLSQNVVRIFDADEDSAKRIRDIVLESLRVSENFRETTEMINSLASLDG